MNTLELEAKLAEVRRETIQEAVRRIRAAYGDDSMEDAGSQAVAAICASIVEAMLTEQGG